MILALLAIAINCAPKSGKELSKRDVRSAVRSQLFNMYLMQSLFGPMGLFLGDIFGSHGHNKMDFAMLNNMVQLMNKPKNNINTNNNENDDEYGDYYDNDYYNDDEDFYNDDTNEVSKRDIKKALRQESFRMMLLQNLLQQQGGLGSKGGPINPMLLLLLNQFGTNGDNSATNSDYESDDYNDDYYYY